ncbi:MAG: HNH endonuclease [Lactobacillus sp.]|nr:HNH endonuclease [Lactobacillus sp.]MCH3905722.1 HNH endonuclease [Lactobacillus sp.]MCH3990709.1 HNH endonuclease [Lactobacillus sp.]MCH4068575.1 HNH endonuclease [Lactobacillus sp.]MCI1304130.1 HNH endonuclease [Lactobacillus sp.]
MKFKCPACGLRMNALHFKQAGLVNDQLTSICDLCLERGLSVDDYGNTAIEVFAGSLLYQFAGGKEDGKRVLKVSRETTRAFEGLLQDYDGSRLARQQIDRTAFNKAVIDSEDGKLPVPEMGADFADNLAKLGLKINFQLNDVDFVDRERIRTKYNYRCQYCGRRGHSVDHMHPVSLSHDNDLENLTLACSECNRIKSNMPYYLFIRLNRRLGQVNDQLVRYEDSLETLKGEFKRRRKQLTAEVRRSQTYRSPKLTEMRQHNKQLQDAIDSLQSDYDHVRALRKSYFETGWKLDQISHRTDII